MLAYVVIFARSARKELQTLPHNQAERILDKVNQLALEPRPIGCKKLKGPSQLWRVRVGEYRIIYDILDEGRVIDILVIRHRSEAYR